ncbi:MAG: CoA-binding protein [Bacteroidota bacterium]
MTQHEAISEFLAQRTLAVVGVSRNHGKFGFMVYQALKARGYRVFPVNPHAETIMGEQAYKSLESLPQKVDGVLVVVSPLHAQQVVKEAFEAGIRRVWMQQGSESSGAVRYCGEKGMSVVYGKCILMFTEPVTSYHKLHRWVWKITGKLPRQTTVAGGSSAH